MVILDKRRRLRRANVRDQTVMVRMRGIKRMQADRIQELQGKILMEQEGTNAFREQL